MVRYSLCLLGICLLCSCSLARTTEQSSSVQTPSPAWSGIGYYAQARLALHADDVEEALRLTRKAQDTDPVSPHPILLEAEILIKAGRIKESLAAVDRAIGIAPDFRQPYLLGASIMSSMGRAREAAAYLRHAVRIEPDKEDAVLHLTTILMQSSEYDEAVKILQDLIRQKSDSAVGNYYLGKLYSQMKLYRESLPYYKKAIELRPDLIQASVDMAIAFERLGEQEKAIETYKQVVEQADNRAPLVQHLIQLFIQNQRYEEALVYLKKLDEMGLANFETQRKTGLIYLELERYDDAIKLFSQMLMADPGAHQIRVYLGSAYEEKEELGKAEAEFLKIPADSSVYPEAAGRLAFIYNEQGKSDKGLNLLVQAIAANPDKLELYLSLATLYEAVERIADGLTLLLGVESKFAEEARYQFRLGILHDKLGQRPQSIERMKKVVALNPRDAQAHNYLGYTYAEMGINLDEALKHVKIALEIRPDDGFFIDSLGWVYFQMKRYEDAVRYLEKAAELVNDDPTILEHLGDAYLARKDLRLALRYYKKARALAPKKKELDDKIKRLTIRMDADEK